MVETVVSSYCPHDLWSLVENVIARVFYGFSFWGVEVVRKEEQDFFVGVVYTCCLVFVGGGVVIVTYPALDVGVFFYHYGFVGVS